MLLDSTYLTFELTNEVVTEDRKLMIVIYSMMRILLALKVSYK